MLFKPVTTKLSIEHLQMPTDYIPLILFSTEALMKMKVYVDEHDKEISWLGVVEQTEEAYIVTDVMLFEQRVTGVTTDILETSLTSFGSKLIAEGKADLFNKIRLWGHSHVNMTCFASKTDEETFEQFYPSCDFFIRLIANKKEEIKVDFVDMQRHMKYENIPWSEIKSDEQIKLEQMMAEFNAKYLEKFNAIKELAKQEIKTNILPNVSFTYTSPNINQYDQDDDVDFDTEETYTKFQNKYEKDKKFKKKEPESNISDNTTVDSYAIRYSKTGNKPFYVKIKTLFSMDKIIEIITCGLNWMDLRETYMDDPRFIKYSDADWKDLFDAISDTYLDETDDYEWYYGEYYSKGGWS